MSFLDWLRIVQTKDQEINVGKVGAESIDVGEMAIASPIEATRKLARVIEQNRAVAKILVVGDGSFSSKLTDYAIKMGLRLDYEIIALSIFDRHCCQNRDLSESEKSHFLMRSEQGVEIFADKAFCCGVKFHQIVRIGSKESVVDQVVKEHAGIRYVLSEPDLQTGDSREEFVQLPVVNAIGSDI